MTELPATFGKYYLTEKLATGGMAEIYLAKIFGPGGFEKQLVIKQIHPRLSGQRHFVDLFVAEAKTLVGLTHGNIVPVYELGVVGDTYFLAMEYIDGPTLYRFTEAVAAAGRCLAPPVAAWIAAEILEGLDYAHRKGEGVIHRDLSPRNVMTSRDGEVKIVDFGIAVTVDARDVDAGDGLPTGSLAYMAPEQARRQRLSAASDLFSAGVLLWEMLTGARLFARPRPEDTLRAVLEEPIPPPSSLRPDVPARLDDVVARALARDVDARWSSAAQFRAELHRYLYGLEVVPGARDLAALVARYCPPGPRRAPTSSRSEPGAGPGDGDGPVTAPRDDGPATVPVARGEPIAAGAGHEEPVHTLARGKGRPGGREATFATHVEFVQVLARATPLFSFPAIRDEPAPATARALDPAAGSGAALAAETSTPAARPAAWRRRVAWMAAAAVVAVAIAALAYRTRSGSAVRGGVPLDGGVVAPPAISDIVVDAGHATGGAAADGGPAGDRTPSPAGATGAPAPGPVRTAPRAEPVHRDPAPAPSGKIQVGASPWGEVYVDGNRIGRTPGTWSVAAGAHRIEVVFPGTEAAQRRTFDVTVTPGEITPVFAEFTP